MEFKFESILQICKEGKNFSYMKDEDGCQWIGDGNAFYFVSTEKPFTNEYLTACAKLSKKDFDIVEFHPINLYDQFELEADIENEKPCGRASFDICINKTTYKIVYTSEGARLIPEKYLKVFDDYDIFEKHDDAGMYFAIKQGMFVKAVIADEWKDVLTVHVPGISKFADDAMKAANGLQLEMER